MLVWATSGCAGGGLAQTNFGFPNSLHQSGLSLQTTEALSLIGKSAESLWQVILACVGEEKCASHAVLRHHLQFK